MLNSTTTKKHISKYTYFTYGDVCMTNMTLALPEELHKIIKNHKEIKWSEVARQAMWQQAKKLQLMDELLSNSKLSKLDAKEIGEKVKEGIARKHGLLK